MDKLKISGEDVTLRKLKYTYNGFDVGHGKHENKRAKRRKYACRGKCGLKGFLKLSWQ